MTESARVLLVDDEQDFLETMSFWLTSKGYQVSTALNGPRALGLLQGGQYNVVFLDVLLPEMDGIEILRRIRMFNKTIPVILVTTSPLTDKNTYAGAMAMGISGVFPKGSSPEQLGEVLQVALRMIRKSELQSVVPVPDQRPTLASTIRAFLRTVREKLTPRKR